VPEQPTKGAAALYLEIPSDLRERLAAFVKRTRRTLKGEVCNAIEQYLNREEAAESSEPRQSQTPPVKRHGKKKDR
jgi:hypothetical protein